MIKSQNATATIENALSCAGDTALVAVDVLNFIDVGAMSLYISYDTNIAEFLTLQNINPSVPGFIFSNANNGVISIVYSNVNGFTINDGKLFDLSFEVLGDSTYMVFINGTEVANSDLEIIPLDTYPGSISNGLVIYDQPDSIQAYPNTDIIFSIGISGSPDLQWQENAGSDWIDLQNDLTYSGVNNDTLNIYDIPLSFDGNLYRCVLTLNNCSVASDVALLEVASAFPSAMLGTLLSCPDAEVLEPVMVTDFTDIIEFTFNISYNINNLNFNGIENTHPELAGGTLTTTPITTNPPGISIHWEHTSPAFISEGKLFDLNFNYISQYNILAFEAGSQALNSFLNPIDLTLIDGYINQYALPQITQQPENITVTEEDDAVFQVTATGASGYQWLISTDEGQSWTELTENIPYSNVNTDMLTISPATLDLDGYFYACNVVNNQYCQITSEAAILSVDSLTYVSDFNLNNKLTLSPNPCQDDLWLHTSLSIDNLQVNVFDLRGIKVHGLVGISHAGPSATPVDLSPLDKGFYFVELTGYIQGRLFRETKKIIKLN